MSSHPPGVTLYRDDIEEVLDLLRTKCDSVAISDEKFSYDTLDEVIQQRGVRPTALSLTGRHPAVVLNLGHAAISGGVWLYANDDDGAVLYHHIEALLLNRRSLLARVLDGRVWRVVFVIGGLAILVGRYRKPWEPLELFGDILVLLALVAWVSGDLAGRSKLNLNRRHESTTFLSRNMDKLLLALASGAIGALLSALAMRWIGTGTH